MCLICGQEVQFFAGVPTGGAHPGALAFDTAANYALYVYNAGWQLAGAPFSGGFNPGGGTMPADYQAVKFFDGVPTGGAPQGTIAFNTSVSPYPMYVFSGGWQEIGVSSTPALDLMGVCGPNVLFGPTPPSSPKNPPGVGTVIIPPGGGTPYVWYPPGGGTGWQPIGLGSALMSIIYDTQGLMSITIPPTWGAPNRIDCLAAGGAGGNGTNGNLGGGGGGGGGYAFATDVFMPAGMAVACFIGQEFGTRDTFIEDEFGNVVCEASGGTDGANGGGGGTGGHFVTGDGGNSGGDGGDGGTGAGGAGGGGAGGPLGNGARGGDTGGSFSGASGGGANNGTAGQSGAAETGGNGSPGGAPGSTGGLGCALGVAPGVINEGTLGGSGGGGGGKTTPGTPSDLFPGGASSIDQSFGPNNGCGGGGCGGGGTVNTAAQTGNNGGAGHGNSGGGGGGGGGGSSSAPADGSAGTGGLIKLTWTSFVPAVRVTTAGNFRVTTGGANRVTAN